MSEHTEGRLRADGPLVGISGKTIFVAASDESGEELDRANARRLVACWNACLGYDTEYLEKIVAGKDEDAQFERVLERDRDELLAALRYLLQAVDVYYAQGSDRFADDERKEARAILAKHAPKEAA